MSWAQFWVTGWGVEDSDSPRWRFIKQQLQLSINYIYKYVI